MPPEEPGAYLVQGDVVGKPVFDPCGVPPQCGFLDRQVIPPLMPAPSIYNRVNANAFVSPLGAAQVEGVNCHDRALLSAARAVDCKAMSRRSKALAELYPGTLGGVVAIVVKASRIAQCFCRQLATSIASSSLEVSAM